jgi:hypothetical protein
MILFVVFVANVSCIERPLVPAYKGNDDDKNLLGSWSHSFEEEPTQGDIEIYRPTDSREFPLAWFRMRYVFKENRSCEWHVLHPADAHYMQSGTWGVDHRDNRLVLIYDTDGLVENVSFRVVELTAEILRVKRLSN